MKTVFTGAEVPHIFATQSQPEGRNANRTLQFDGPTLRSYAQPIAHFLAPDHVLITADSFSVTTSKHTSWARYALRHIPQQTYVPSLKQLLGNTAKRYRLEYIKARIEDADKIRDKMTRMRADWKKRNAESEIAMHEAAAALAWQMTGESGDWRDNAAPAIAAQIRADKVARYTAAFNSLQFMVQEGHLRTMERAESILADSRDRHLRHAEMVLFNAANDIQRADSLQPDRPLPTPNWTEARQIMGNDWANEYSRLSAELAAIVAPIWERAQTEKLKNDAQAERDNADKILQWLAGENVSIRHIGRILCRVINGDTVETSQGARVPLGDAERVVKLAMRCRDTGAEIRKDAFATGPYKGILITAAGDVTIGCHSLPWQSIAECVARFKPELMDEESAE
jgi:hypothetical protein